MAAARLGHSSETPLEARVGEQKETKYGKDLEAGVVAHKADEFVDADTSAESLLLSPAADILSFCPSGKDEASSVEVTWPDGKMVSRNVASREMNSVLEIPYPRDEDTLQDPAPLEVGKGIWAS
ncbi:hypothetical protein P7K49_024214 [Saguinus oedipus]|uniref:ASPIC/UnbV domain-containing protein n=1 Tax=Saguinus oedipus TaxID=9490 RepID=A0ABQ9UNW3_SAGOE|nr:hypothetical protein P7K49_024214 [Saguinus oedipus]